jgi:hypothetical protein
LYEKRELLLQNKNNYKSENNSSSLETNSLISIFLPSRMP